MYYFFLKFWKTSPVKPSRPGFLCWKFLNYKFNFFNIYGTLQVIGFTLVELHSLCFSRNLSIVSKLLNYIIQFIITDYSFTICKTSSDITSFIPDIFIFCFSLSFLTSLARDLSILLTFSKTSFWFHWLFPPFLSSFFFSLPSFSSLPPSLPPFLPSLF